MRALQRLLALLALFAPFVTGAGARAATDVPPSAPDAASGAPSAADFFRDPALSHLSLSPDGGFVAGVASRGGVRWVVARATQGGQLHFLARLDAEGRDIRKLGWASDERILVGVEMASPISIGTRERQSRLFVVPLHGASPYYVGSSWPYHRVSQWQDEIIDWRWGDPDHVMLNWWQPDQNGASARLVDLRRGRLVPVVRFRPLVTRWAVDHLGQVRAGWGAPRTRSGYFLYARSDPDGGFEKVIDFDPLAETGFFFAGFSKDPTQLYVTLNDASGGGVVSLYDIPSRQLGPRIFSAQGADIDALHFSSRDGRLLSIGYTTDRPRLHFVDEEARAEQERLDRRFPGTTNRILGRDREEDAAIVEVSGDTVPPRFYYRRRGSRRIELLVDAYPELASRELAPMQPVSFPTRDGRELAGTLTLPPGAARTDLPAIVYLNGAPTTRGVWGYDPTVQFLASRGFAVLQPICRGASGYGSRHPALGHRRWGLAEHDDVEDAARWLVARGTADPRRLGIYGVGYGGYAALLALAKAPELFAAGASLGAVTDLGAMQSDEAWYYRDPASRRTVGGWWGNPTRLREGSPLELADRIRVPVLLAHGSADDRVHVRHGERMADALEAGGGPVELLLYPDEVQGFLDERSRIDFHERLASFFARHLLEAIHSQHARVAGTRPARIGR